MKHFSRPLTFLVLYYSLFCGVKSQTYLKADGNAGSTYDLINRVLGGGRDAVEPPDCAHPSFPKHISQIHDKALNRPVFSFYLHVTPDNDGCNGKTDRSQEYGLLFRFF